MAATPDRYYEFVGGASFEAPSMPRARACNLVYERLQPNLVRMMPNDARIQDGVQRNEQALFAEYRDPSRLVYVEAAGGLSKA